MADEEKTRCICGYTHTTRLMICCDNCNVWLHADCFGLDRRQLREYEKKNIDFFCNQCQPRQDLDLERARALQRVEHDRLKEKADRRRRRPASSSSESSDDDDNADGPDRRPSREDRKAMEYEKLFDKMKKDENKRRRKERRDPSDEAKVISEEEEDPSEPSEEEEATKTARGRGRRGRPPKNKNRGEKDDRRKRRNEPEETSTGMVSTRRKPGRKPGRQKGQRKVVEPEVTPEVKEVPIILAESDTESADSGLEDETVMQEPMFEAVTRHRKRPPLDIKKFENIPQHGMLPPPNDIHLTWRSGNNSCGVIAPANFTETTEPEKGHYRKQWSKKHAEATKDVPLVEDIVKQELRKRNIDLSTIEALNNSANSDQTSLMDQSQTDETSSQDSETSMSEKRSPASTEKATSPDNNADNSKKTQKLSLSDYLKRQREKNKKLEEERAKEEAERIRQQNNRLSSDAVSAVLHSAVDAASKGSRVSTVTPDDLEWLTQLGVNLHAENAEDLNQAATQLAKDTEQILNIFRAANILASLTAQKRLSRRKDF